MAEELTQTVSHALPTGFVIQEYEFLSVLGMGGFGITYLANDANLKLKVAIKEFFPASLAIRDPNTNQVAVKSEEYQADFAWGKERFIQEAQTLAKFSHPNIVHIYRYFVANGTGYMVMDYEEGRSLEDELNDKEIQWDDARVMEFLLPLLDGIAHVHKAGFLHRDIKPGNIVIRKKDSSPVLLDFGSARAALISHTQTLTALVSPGYCPVEQYFDDGTQAACTDIYSIGAVLYRIVTGVTPTPSPQRVKKDSMIPAGFAGRKKFGVALLRAIDKALSIEASKRPQSIEAWQAILQESAQKAELKNVSEKTGRFVGKGYKRLNKITIPFVISIVIIFISAVYFTRYLDDYTVSLDERARQGDTVALERLKFVAGMGSIQSLNSVNAQRFLANIYAYGKGVPKDDVQAVIWYRKTAEQKISVLQYISRLTSTSDAQSKLGNMYQLGKGVPKDSKEASKWYEQAVIGYRKLAEEGVAVAQTRLGTMYEKGKGVPKDETQAVAWYRKSAEQGNNQGQNNLGFMYREGKGVSMDYVKALTWFRKAAEQENAEAQANMGLMYAKGHGVPEDYVEALKWLRMSVEQENPKGQAYLGDMYLKGLGVPQDYAQAVAWYQKAAKQGEALGQTNLGTMYLNGQGVLKDDMEALKWLQMAAEQNNADALNKLGAMYQNGLGVPRDDAQAAIWYQKAAETK